MMLLSLNHKVHVLFRRQDLDMVKLEGKVVIVLDILFATSTMVTALAHGASAIVPTMDGPGAKEAAKAFATDSYVLSGELLAETIEGFASPTPLALLEHGVEGKTVIYSTTNGTVALKDSSVAPHVFAGALLNARAIVEHIAARHREGTILIVCSGSMGNPNLEDMYGGGYFVDLIAQELGDERDLSDAALAARALFRSESAESALLRGRVGHMMVERGLIDEVRFAAQLSTLDVVPKLMDGVLKPI